MAALEDALPPAVLELSWREREVATIVYSNGAQTAKDVVYLLAGSISNGAVRSMLNRLVAKKILVRSWGAPGRGRQYVYTPAIMPSDVRLRAVHSVAEIYFEGSLVEVARTVLALLEESGSSRPADPPPLQRHVVNHAQLAA